MKKVIIISLIVLVILVAFFVWLICFVNQKEEPVSVQNQETPSFSKLVSQVSYACDGSKTIEANYFEGTPKESQPGEPPIPNGNVKLVLSDGRNLDLPRTISGSGIRYANSDESVIFWSKGETAFVIEGEQETYQNCVEK